jgi:uncharacterized integral membrane protein
MRRLLYWIFLLPLAILTVLFAVANREHVVVSFDPFSSRAPAFAISLPLFIVIFLAIIIGVVLGGLASLTRHYRLWRAARQAREEIERYKADAEAERRAREAVQPEYHSLPAPH